jgi:hypothetical protein
MKGREDPRSKRVLILFNEGRDAPGNITLQQAFQAELQKLCTNQVDFFDEHLYARHFPDQAHFQIFQDYLGKKYAGQQLDLIMAFPSGDYTLAGALPEALFPDVPVVFVSVNELEVPYAIRNGMDAMADGAKSARTLTVRAEPTKDGGVQVAVSDCGIGILPDKLERLFDPFFTTKPGGMGMGLAISNTIIEAHGGKIQGGNNATRGAIFKFTLPANES